MGGSDGGWKIHGFSVFRARCSLCDYETLLITSGLWVAEGVERLLVILMGEWDSAAIEHGPL